MLHRQRISIRFQPDLLPLRRPEDIQRGADAVYQPGVQDARDERGRRRAVRPEEDGADRALPRLLRAGHGLGLHRELPLLAAPGPGRLQVADGADDHSRRHRRHTAAGALRTDNQEDRPRQRDIHRVRLLRDQAARLLADIQSLAVSDIRGDGERHVLAEFHRGRHLRGKALDRDDRYQHPRNARGTLLRSRYGISVINLLAELVIEKHFSQIWLIIASRKQTKFYKIFNF